MKSSISFIQTIFTIITILFSISFSISYFEGGLNLINFSLGLLGGAIFAALLIGFGSTLKKFNLREFNIAILGLFFGFLLGKSILFLLNGILVEGLSPNHKMPIHFITYLITSYLGMLLTLRASEEIHFCIPFVEFKQNNRKKKDILVDLSITTDSRIIDLATTGLLDQHLIIPRFALKELYIQAESMDEQTKLRAKRSLEVLKKLECLTTLDLRYTEMDFPEIKDPMSKLIHLARFLDTHIITSDINRIQQSSIEGIRIINIHMLSNALKPITQAGESISIKIQRYGKEARQGVGYLEDGTMVVVNGGAEFIGETIKAHVLSVKHTSSGRMIFCNASDETGLLSDEDDLPLAPNVNSPKNYFAL